MIKKYKIFNVIKQYSIKWLYCSIVTVFVSLFFTACQKELKLNFDNAKIRQVIISNFTPNNYLTVNISKSKRPDDFSSVEFLNNCKVDLFENDLYKETMNFVLKDTLSGLGYYTSSFKLTQNKTYKIISTHPELGTAEATEYLPPIPRIENFALLQHADSLQPNKRGMYILVFQDSADISNYYFLSTFYRILVPRINNSGDTVYRYDFIGNIPSYTPAIPNLNNSNRSFTTDNNFNGQLTSLTVDFQSIYKTEYKEILLIIELSNLGKNFYTWNVEQMRYDIDFWNDGQFERFNISSNIINGFGHFTANSSAYITIPIR